MQSIEHTLRASTGSTGANKAAPTARKNAHRLSGAGPPAFRARSAPDELLARQAQLNAALDLDKSAAQARPTGSRNCDRDRGGPWWEEVNYVRLVAGAAFVDEKYAF
jgi:hypothetical protein